MTTRIRTAVGTTLIPVWLILAVGCGGDSGQTVDDTELPANRALYFPAQLVETAPESFQVRFETSRGDFVVAVTRSQAPNGADRVYNLVRNGYYDGVRFYRVIEGFMAQFGMHGEPQVQVRWTNAPIRDDRVAASNTRGAVTFAMAGPNSRTTQLFINLVDNTLLDMDGFAPVGTVMDGMDVVDQLYAGYGEIADRGGDGPISQNIAARGNAYLEESFPEMDYIVTATLVDPAGG